MTTKPRVALLFRTHYWPLSDRVRFDTISLSLSFQNYVKSVEAYNQDLKSKYYIDIWISYDHGANSDYNLHTWDIFNIHHYSFDSVKEHGFVHSRHPDLAPNIKQALKSCAKAEPATQNPPMDFELDSWDPDPMWFNPEYGLLDFYLTKESSYQYYWMFEYDVWFRGDLSKYLQAFDYDHSDFLCYGISYHFDRVNRHKLWDYDVNIGFKTFNPKEHDTQPHRGYWGGPGRVGCDVAYGGYFPVTRFSNAAVSSLCKAYVEDRICGFCEILVPSYLKHNNFVMDNLKHKSHIYTADCTVMHKANEYLGIRHYGA